MFLGIEYIISRCKYVCQHYSHRSTPLIDLQKQFLETFLIGGHEEGGVGKCLAGNTSQGGLYATENLSKPLAQSRTSVLWSFLRQRTDEGTKQLEVYGDNLIALASSYLSNGNFKINH